MTPERHDQPDETLIHAWLDGALDPQSEAARQARAAYEADPQLAARINHEREADGLLSNALNAYARTNNHLPVIDHAVARADMSDRIIRGGIAAALALTLFSGGWFTNALMDADPHSSEADITQLAYLEGESALSPVSLGNADLHEPVMVPPRLAGFGLNLTSVETRSIDGGVLNRMEYQRSDGTEIRILVRSENRFHDEAVTTASLDGRPLVYWREGNMTVGVTGAVSEQELESIALDVRQQARAAGSGPVLTDSVTLDHTIQTGAVHEASIPPG